MSRKVLFPIVTALVVAVGLFLAGRLRYPGEATIRLPTGQCDASLWKHVGTPERLHVIEACAAVEGRVLSQWRASDGDLHIALDPDRKSVLNFVNVIHASGTLVVEIICEHAPTDAEDAKACAGFTSQVVVPELNDHVRVTGAYVTDSENGWNEVHPVTHIEILR